MFTIFIEMTPTRYICAGSEDGSAYLFDLRRVGGPLERLRRPGPGKSAAATTAAVTDVAFNPDGREIVAASQDGFVIVARST